MALSISSRSDREIAIVQLHGKLTLGPHLSAFQKRVQRMLGEGGCRGLVLNFADVTALDSAGIGALVMVRTHAAGRGVRVGIAEASPRVKQMLAITRVDELFAFGDNERSAVQNLSPAR